MYFAFVPAAFARCSRTFPSSEREGTVSLTLPSRRDSADAFPAFAGDSAFRFAASAFCCSTIAAYSATTFARLASAAAAWLDDSCRRSRLTLHE